MTLQFRQSILQWYTKSIHRKRNYLILSFCMFCIPLEGEDELENESITPPERACESIIEMNKELKQQVEDLKRQLEAIKLEKN